MRKPNSQVKGGKAGSTCLTLTCLTVNSEDLKAPARCRRQRRAVPPVLQARTAKLNASMAALSAAGER
jgi:hypothetical protein